MNLLRRKIENREKILGIFLPLLAKNDWISFNAPSLSAIIQTQASSMLAFSTVGKS